jgi:hypothetical protein
MMIPKPGRGSGGGCGSVQVHCGDGGGIRILVVAGIIMFVGGGKWTVVGIRRRLVMMMRRVMVIMTTAL